MLSIDNLVITSIEDAQVISVGKNDCRNIVNRTYFGLSFCIDEGHIVYEHNGKNYISDSEHVLIHPRGESYKLTGIKMGKFPLIEFMCLDEGIIGNDFYSIPVADIRYFERIFNQLQKYYFMDSKSYKTKCLSLFYEFLSELFSVSSKSKEERILMPALEYLANNFTDSMLSIERLAEISNVSDSYFRKIFKQIYGQSPRKYLMDMRIQKAKELIRTTSNLVIKDIAADTGFASTYVFCRSFKEAVGCTATEYAEKTGWKGL